MPDPDKILCIGPNYRDHAEETGVQSGTTASMIFPVAEVIAFISRVMTLEPGDIIATGTPAGVGFTRTPPLLLGPDDVVEVEIEGLGRLANPVVEQANVRS